jgi:4-hydroxybenzoate polyprenyltransferase
MHLLRKRRVVVPILVVALVAGHLAVAGLVAAPAKLSTAAAGAAILLLLAVHFAGFGRRRPHRNDAAD